ncbi:MAG: trigger factor [Dehalococcoidia bacterium]
MLKVTEERIGSCQAVLNIEVGEERVEAALRRASQRISQRVQIPGFRKGKAPYRVVLQSFSEEAIYNEALKELGSEVYREALADRGIEPFDQASLDVIQLKPLILKITVPLEPIVELGGYRQTRLTPEEVSVEEEEVNALLAQIQRENAQEVPVERPTKLGDCLTIDVEGSVDGKPIIKVEGERFIPAADMPNPAPGFSEQLVGMMAGQEKEFPLVYPADYSDESLAGEEAAFCVFLHEVKEIRLPAIDDDLARTVGDFETLDELKGRLREGLRAEAESEAQERFAEKVLATVIAQAKIEFPPILLEREIDRMVEERVARLRRLGFTLEGYLKAIEKSEEEWREELGPQAEERLKRSLVLGEVAELEGIEVEAAEIEEEIDRRAQLLGDQADAARESLSSAPSRHNIALELYGQRALQRLVEIATEGPEPEPKV